MLSIVKLGNSATDVSSGQEISFMYKDTTGDGTASSFYDN